MGSFCWCGLAAERAGYDAALHAIFLAAHWAWAGAPHRLHSGQSIQRRRSALHPAEGRPRPSGSPAMGCAPSNSLNGRCRGQAHLPRPDMTALCIRLRRLTPGIVGMAWAAERQHAMGFAYDPRALGQHTGQEMRASHLGVRRGRSPLAGAPRGLAPMGHAAGGPRQRRTRTAPSDSDAKVRQRQGAKHVQRSGPRVSGDTRDA